MIKALPLVLLGALLCLAATSEAETIASPRAALSTTGMVIGVAHHPCLDAPHCRKPSRAVCASYSRPHCCARWRCVR
jgi:hypothetical protein